MAAEKPKSSRKWTVLPDNTGKAEVLAKVTGVSTFLASLLLNRSINTPEKVADFITPSLNNLHDPFLMANMRDAVERINRAIAEREKILIWGDYDVDGTISALIIVQYLRLMDADCSYHIPSRMLEGYGLNKEKILESKQNGVSLIITVDTGVGSVSEINYAQEIGVDVVITDHHVAGGELPLAYCIVNPKQNDCSYPHLYLAGVGVVFKLIWALAETLPPSKRESREFIEFLDNAIGFVAIATIVDVVPLLDENRIFVKFGLLALNKTTNPGLRALLELCILDNVEIDPSHVGFRIGPRLNAGGRLGKEDLGLQLFLCDSYSEALQIAVEIDNENKHRQEIEKEIVKNAFERVKSEIDLDSTPIIVMASEDWHVGVIGIVATRITEEFWRPTVLISLDGDSGRGSARSIPDFNIYDGLKNCEDLLINFGGHNYAAGLEINKDKIDELRNRLFKEAFKQLNLKTLLPTITIEKEIKLSNLTMDIIREIQKLEPFGEGNRPPVFYSNSVMLIGKPKMIGRDDNHLTFYVKDSNDPSPKGIRAIAFYASNFYDTLISNRDEFKIAFSPRLNTYYGEAIIELVIKDIHFK